MAKAFRYDAIGVLLLGLVSVQGCSLDRAANTAMPSVDAAKPPTPVFSLNTPVNKIAADPRGKAILERDVPGLLSNRNYMLINDMSLSQIASVSCGRLTATRLDQVEADLTQLSQRPPQ